MKKLPKDSSVSWMLLIEGLAQFILGLLLLFSTDMTLFVLIQLLGIYWLIRGIIMVMRVFSKSATNKSWSVLGGIIGIIAGILVLRYPLFSGFVMMDFLVVIIAIVGLIQGVISFVEGISLQSAGEVLLGVVLLVVCMLLLTNPLSSVIALAITIGIIWVISGIVLTIAAISSRKQ